MAACGSAFPARSGSGNLEPRREREGGERDESEREVKNERGRRERERREEVEREERGMRVREK